MPPSAAGAVEQHPLVRSAMANPPVHVQILLVLVLIVAGIATAQQVERISTGQQFADRVLQWVSKGGTITLAIDQGNVSLAGCLWPPSSSSSSQWQQSKAALTVAGSTVVPFGQLAPIRKDVSLLDFAMKSSLTPPFDNPGITLDFKNVVMVNLCSVLLAWFPDRNWFFTASSNNDIMPRSRFVLTQTRTNVSLYVSQGELTGMVYWQAMYHIPFEDVHTFVATKLLNKQPPQLSVVAAVSKYHVLLANWHLPGGIDTWVDMRATNNPDDPLRLGSLGGTLMDHRWCNNTDGASMGPLMTLAQQSMNETMFPLWIAENDTDMRAALVEIAAHATTRRDVDPYLTLLITGNVSMPPQDWTLRSDVIILGPFNHVPGFEVHVSLDMTNLSIDLTSAYIMLANMTIHGLTADLLPGTRYSSVLGFDGLRRGDSGGVRLANVRLIVPQDDFAALLAAALRGSLWALGASTTAALMNGITEFQPDPIQTFNHSQLVLKTYRGWGVDASNLIVIPSSPLPDNSSLPDLIVQPGNAPNDASSIAPYGDGPLSGSASGLSSAAKVGIIAGVCCGAVAILAVVAWTVRRHIRCWQFKPREKNAAFSMPYQIMVTDGVHSPNIKSSPALNNTGTPVGLLPRDPFLAAAPGFSWVDYPPTAHTTWVESGINDTQLDKLSQDGTCPAVELKAADMGQIELLTNGLIGKGGAALVFACRWPKRFGPDALLAIKVLRNAYDASPVILQSFTYEAHLLASLRSPHVVKLYGYCLELPVVALIMELLPTSLESLLHPTPQQAPFYLMYASSASLTAAASESAVVAQASSDMCSQAVASKDRKMGLTWPNTITSSPASTSSQAQYSSMTAKPDSINASPSLAASKGTSSNRADTAVTRCSTLSMLSILQIAADVSAGLAYLHNRTADLPASIGVPVVDTATGQQDTSGVGDVPRPSKIVHRDLKPANLLINSRGQAKIVDFGLAREFATTTMHTMHAGAGTLLYMAPELLAARMYPGAQPAKPTYLVDIYSLGILMWEMLSQQKPWQDMNMAQLVAAVCGQQRPPMPHPAQATTSARGLDLASTPAGFGTIPEFDNLIRQCWQHRDLRRPQAAEVLSTLRRLLQQTPTAGRATAKQTM